MLKLVIQRRIEKTIRAGAQIRLEEAVVCAGFDFDIENVVRKTDAQSVRQFLVALKGMKEGKRKHKAMVRRGIDERCSKM